MSKTGISVGSKAPNFKLPDQDGREVALSDFAGRWVVLYFYPRDSTPGCTIEACDFTAGLAGFEKLDAVVLGCSPDSPASHREFIARYKLQLTLLSDPEHKVLQIYGAWGQKTIDGKTREGVIRSTAIVDPAGRIAHHFPKVTAEGHAAEVQSKLAELRK
jgi:thioredoxin-dependent peroxiredoxin